MTAQTSAPKRRNAEKTRARILDVAQKMFSAKGYSQTGIRDIAAGADISSPLLLRYFGSKAGLFEEALAQAMQSSRLFDTERQHFGKHLAELMMDKERSIIPPSIIALSSGDEEARDIASSVAQEKILNPLAQWLGPPMSDTRALEILMMSMGFLMFTRLFPLGDAIGEDLSELEQRFALSIQAIVDEV